MTAPITTGCIVELQVQNEVKIKTLEAFLLCSSLNTTDKSFIAPSQCIARNMLCDSFSSYCDDECTANAFFY